MYFSRFRSCFLSIIEVGKLSYDIISLPGEPHTTAHSRNAGSSFLKKQTYDTCTQLCGAVDQSSRQSLGLSSCTVFPAPLYHEGNSTQMTMIMKRRLLLFFCCLFGKYIHMIRATVGGGNMDHQNK